MATKGIKNWPPSTFLLLIDAFTRENPGECPHMSPEARLPGEHLCHWLWRSILFNVFQKLPVAVRPENTLPQNFIRLHKNTDAVFFGFLSKFYRNKTVLI